VKLLRLIVFLLLASCASLRPEPVIDVDVQLDSARDRWTVRYHLPRVASSARFLRPRSIPRSERWAIIGPPGAIWHQAGETETIAFPRPTNHFVLEFPSDTRELLKDYELNYTFNDGGRLLYTGHLVLTADDQPGLTHQWTFRTPKATRILTVGHEGTGELRWKPDPEPEDGTYVYFGPSAPIETDRMQMVLDPGLPGWISSEVQALLPSQFDYFARMTGFELDFKPLIFLSYEDSDKTGFVFSGGTVPGTMVVGVEGRAWLKPTPEASQLWFFHLAHEAFHMSNGEMFQPREDAQWLSEGSADYFALLAAREAGVLDQKQVERRLINAADRCVQRLGSLSLAAAGGARKFDAFYSCGNVLSFAVDQAIRRRSGGQSHIGTLFHRIFSSALESRHYSTEDFLRELEFLAGPETRTRVQQILDTGLGTDPARAIATLLEAVELSQSGRITPRRSVP
jgi:hypothetical protein